MTTAATFAEFATRDAHGESPSYERLSFAVSRDAELRALLGELPPAKRKANLLFGVFRFAARRASRRDGIRVVSLAQIGR